VHRTEHDLAAWEALRPLVADYREHAPVDRAAVDGHHRRRAPTTGAVLTHSEPRAESVLMHIEPMEWSDEQSVAYEVAVEGLSRAIGIQSTLMWREQQRAAPDVESLREWNANRQRLVRRRETLRPDDREAVRQVQQECAEIIQAFRSSS
jgi:hypothetical protein